VLGLTTTLFDESRSWSSKFGAGRENVIIVLCKDPDDLCICLLQKSYELIFRIDEDPIAPQILSDMCVSALNCCAYWLRDRKNLGDKVDPESCLQFCLCSCEKWLAENGHHDSWLRTKIAATFIFGELVNRYQSVPDLSDSFDARSRERAGPLVNMLLAFACVEDLDTVKELSISFANMYSYHDGPLERQGYRKGFFSMSAALSSEAGEAKDLWRTSLVSCRGWSVHSTILALPDPLNMSKG
jgi:hypothetical protein